MRKKKIRKIFGYSWIKGDLFFTGRDLIIHRCVREDEIYGNLRAFHDESCGGNFAGKQTTYKILRSGYYWPSLFKDAKEYVLKCDRCQRIG